MATQEANMESLNEFVKLTVVKKLEQLCAKIDTNNARMIWLYVSFIIATLGLIGTIIIAVVM